MQGRWGLAPFGALLFLLARETRTCVASPPSGEEGMRRFEWHGHDVATSRAGERGRLLSTVTRGAPAVFLLGYEQSHQAVVSAALSNMGARILQNMPSSNHWLVLSTPADMHSLQEKFPSVTSAVLPKHAKVSDKVAHIVGEVREGGQQAAHEHGEEHPARTLQQEGGQHAWLKELTHYESKDGHTKIILSVDCPAFTTVKSAYCSECPERAAAKKAALAWAQGIRDGLAAHLSLASGDTCFPVIQGFTVIGTLKLDVCLHQAKAAVSWLTEQGEVISVSIKHAKRPQNLHASHAIQTGAVSSALPDNFRSNGTREALFPLWAAGLTGEGQVVGVSDTGVDLDSCYVWDPAFLDYQNNTDNIKNTTDSDGVPFEHFSNANHRKVISYFWFYDKPFTVDGYDYDYDKNDADGHGTHVVGTIAGAMHGFDPITHPDLATGVAPHAKISFFDVLAGDESFVHPGMCVESDEDSGECTSRIKGSASSLFEVQHKDNARISSVSWGSAVNEYTSDCRELDAWLWANDMLILVAAGNDAVNPDAEGILGKIEEPATCKNVLSIGATGNFFNTSSSPDGSDQYSLVDDSGNQVEFSGLGDEFSGEGLLVYELNDNGAKLSAQRTYVRGSHFVEWNGNIVSALGLSAEHELMLAEPFDACSSLNGDYSNKIVVFVDEGCTLSDKASNVKETGAAAGVMVQFSSSLNTDSSVTGLPFVTILESSGRPNFEDIAYRMENGTRFSLMTKGGSPYEHMLTFSSHGPSDSGYIMPKLAAPGILLSAGTDLGYDGHSTCSPEVSLLQGTSMACPAAAGAATLARQYFADGFYPTGSKMAQNAMEPTASLLTAVLVAGAATMDGLATRNGATLSLYDNNQGFGRVDLSTLPLSGVTDPSWKLKVWQKQMFSSAGETKAFIVSATGSAEVVITLAYMDLPAAGTGEPLLRNDLDLKVTAPDGSVLWGNGLSSGDRYNNIEKVVISNTTIQTGNYTVEVTSIAIDTAEGPQSCALAVLGGIVFNETVETDPPAPAPSPVQQPEEFKDNERQVDIGFTMGLTQSQLTSLGDTNSNLYKKLKDELERFLAEELGEGSQVTLLGLTIGSRRRSLQQATTTVTGRFLFRTPEGTSSDDTRTRTNTVLARLNADDGVTYLNSKVPGLAEFKVQGVTAQDTTGDSNAGAKHAHPCAMLMSMVLGAALVVMVL